ncbi:hypothetical protein GQ43DRAFT_32146 [Delitschia confertaspora ATCC 74209]|uniref:RING-type domain-containing protein n=1 Tax=Delitschia confertaspora ATCC 74209 TaxID=1513339 RepID=A0A9P4JL85_9PLEO|nr:hypothetical protein GQ43DRAFT_32146 [Delitschia confertaspora ATCC 74209]
MFTQQTTRTRILFLPHNITTLSPLELPISDRACTICLLLYPFTLTKRSYNGNAPEHSDLPVRLPCGYVFELDCLERWTDANGTSIEGRNKCPMYREVLFLVVDVEI